MRTGWCVCCWPHDLTPSCLVCRARLLLLPTFFRLPCLDYLFDLFPNIWFPYPLYYLDIHSVVVVSLHSRWFRFAFVVVAGCCWFIPFPIWTLLVGWLFDLYTAVDCCIPLWICIIWFTFIDYYHLPSYLCLGLQLIWFIVGALLLLLCPLPVDCDCLVVGVVVGYTLIYFYLWLFPGYYTVIYSRLPCCCGYCPILGGVVVVVPSYCCLFITLGGWFVVCWLLLPIHIPSPWRLVVIDLFPLHSSKFPFVVDWLHTNIHCCLLLIPRCDLLFPVVGRLILTPLNCSRPQMCLLTFPFAFICCCCCYYYFPRCGDDPVIALLIPLALLVYCPVDCDCPVWWLICHCLPLTFPLRLLLLGIVVVTLFLYPLTLLWCPLLPLVAPVCYLVPILLLPCCSWCYLRYPIDLLVLLWRCC